MVRQKQSRLSNDEFKASIGALKRKGLIDLKKEKIIFSANREEISKKTPEEMLLEKLPIEYNTLNNEQLETVKSLEKRKDLIKQKIIELANNQQLTIPEIKDILVDKEGYCSKATFYRYIERLQNTKEIDFVELNERKVVINKKQE